MKTKINEIDGKFFATLEGEMDTTLSKQREGCYHRLYEPGVYCFQRPAHLAKYPEGCQGLWQQGGAAWRERRHQECL